MANKRSIGLAGVTNLSVIAPIKSGLANGFEPISYLERLRKVLNALQCARQNLRESELRGSVFPDTIGRFGIIHNFRYAIVPPLPGADGKPIPGTLWHLSLNVTFDGGWEPYMRVIYRDIGELLDLLFCHSPNYPGSRTSTYGEYCDWVRRNEVEGGLFYADAAVTLEDHQYLAEIEKAQREGTATDADIARIAVPSAAARKRQVLAQVQANPAFATSTLVLPMRTLKGLYRLTNYFGSAEMEILRRFAQSVLKDPIELMGHLDKLPEDSDSGKTWRGEKKRFADELAWLDYKNVQGREQPKSHTLNLSNIQAHIAGGGKIMTHGCLVMLRISDAAQARRTLGRLADRCGAMTDDTGVSYTIAFSYAGLQALGIAQARLDALAPEFIDGMEARCALLGDVRCNHPDHWSRPVAQDSAPGERRIDLGSVHVAVFLQTADDVALEHVPGAGAEAAHDTLHARLRTEVDNLAGGGTGLRVLAIEPTHSVFNESKKLSGHLGFLEGSSQPRLVPSESTLASDIVMPGELLLGHANERGDKANPGLDPLQFEGSYLVVRKLRQHMDRLASALARVPVGRQEETLAKMMGRRKDGSPLHEPKGSPASNNFSFENTPSASAACPYHSHIRRANPRDGRDYTPRILRRGTSYGPPVGSQPDAERGVLFMAYCASIAEQFETIQRWMAGGNSSGVGSAQGDPFLRVPKAGESSTFRYIDDMGDVVRVVFDDKPLVQLQWGMYLFAPALSVLRTLDSFVLPEQREKTTSDKTREPTKLTDAQIAELEREAVRQILEDPEESKAEWQRVREGTSRLQGKAYGMLLGRCQEVLEAMKDGRATRYSVQGYGDRMTASIGLNHLGEDRNPGQGPHPLNLVLEEVSEDEAFVTTLQVAKGVLAKYFPPLPGGIEGEPKEIPIDLLNFSDLVLSGLCKQWIGLPDDKTYMVTGGRLEDNTGITRCPGNLMAVSRYIFTPHPTDEVIKAGQKQGKAVLDAVKNWLASPGPQLGSIALKIQQKTGANLTDEKFANNLAGVLLGFPPTVQGNFIRTMENWIEEKGLWQHQQSLFEHAPGVELTYKQASLALSEALFATMRKRPVPGMLWRSPVTKSGVDKEPSHRVVLGIASALTDETAPVELMFGRDAKEAKVPTVHGCPGYEMATGILLAMIATLLRAGTLRPTGSPVLLILVPFLPEPAVQSMP